MPSRKHDSVENQGSGEGRRGSLRRLGSIPSIHNLNPFSRRRSNNNLEDVASMSTSTAPSSSGPATAPFSARRPSRIAEFQPVEDFAENSFTSMHSRCLPRQGSNSQLLNDMKGMPRSKTSSNLPLPSTKQQASAQQTSPGAPKRWPSTLPSTRLPSPPSTTRKYSSSKLKSTKHDPRTGSMTVQRSETMPLLEATSDIQHTFEQRSLLRDNKMHRPKTQLMKSRLDKIRSSGVQKPFNTSNAARRERANTSESSEPLLDDIKTTTTLPSDINASYRNPPTEGTRTSQTSTKSKPMQRWYSQPTLSGASSKKPVHTISKQPRLTPIRQAPTPSPSTLTLPSASSAKTSVDVDHDPEVDNLSCLQAGSADSTPTPIASRQTLSDPNFQVVSNSTDPLITPGPDQSRIQITSAKPAAFWSGRFSSLNDRLRNEVLNAHMQTLTLDSGAASKTAFQTPRPHPLPDETPSLESNLPRMRSALEHLYALCTNDEARESFLLWQQELAIAFEMPELAKPVCGRSRGANRTSGEYGEGSAPQGLEVGGSSSSGKRRKFIDRLLGRYKRSSTAEE